MLIFTRKKDERLVIGNEIEVTILNIGSVNVKVGITAPRNIPVHRHEVFESLKHQQDPSQPDISKTLL